jgi:hypothetical protein
LLDHDDTPADRLVILRAEDDTWPATARPPAAQRVAASTVELIKDVSVRLAPLTERDAREMIRSLATFPLLDRYRGAPRAAVGDLEDVLLRVSAKSDAHPEISELDLNPSSSARTAR